MNVPENIFLIGPMGAGKTTVGRQLARALGKEFIDCDRALEERTGAPISLIFELEGESGFRKRECMVLAELAEKHDVVLATGGGVVLAEENRARLRSRGFAVYLKAPIELLAERTARDRSRPLLASVDDPKERFAELMSEREPLYQQVADLVVKTNQRTARFVVKEIMKRLATL